jgi:hypothetical protein
MAKAKVTGKWINANYNCISVGYCALEYLLRYQDADFYTFGTYGWNMDVYTFGDYAITTGYRGMIDNCKHTELSALEWNKKAEKIINANFMNYDETKKQVNNLLEEFLRKTFNNNSIKVY